ncbi:MAG: SGNH/GDSL hydrolase family protein [Lysobacteraceae bacterium]
MKVALIGDSIRMHAEPFVRERLPQRIRLMSPPVNCESSHKVAECIGDWVPRGEVDLVHINCGLHDIRYDPGRDRPVSSAEEYAANLRKIFAHLAASGAAVVWATSTPIDEAIHNRSKASRRYRTDLLEYNRRSESLARGFGFRIHDLHSLLSEAPLDTLLLPDGVHYNQAGCALVGQHIADAIEASVVLIEGRAGISSGHDPQVSSNDMERNAHD